MRSMSLVNILDFFDYKDFLIAYADERKKRQATWSFGVWSKSLGITGSGTISRILTGDRVPGEDLTEVLNKYFEFNREEERYFKKLIARERYYQGGVFPGSPLFVLRNGKAVIIQGAVNFERASALLEKRGLEPVRFGDNIVASVNVNSYPHSNYGPYNDSYLCLSAKRKGSGMLDIGLYLTDISCDSQRFIEACDAREAHGARLDKILISESVSGSSCEVSTFLGDASKPFQRFDFSSSSMRKVEEEYELAMYAETKEGKLFRSKFTVDSIAFERPFDESRDICDLGRTRALSETLEHLEFKPVKWVFHRNLFSLVYDPVSIEPRTY
ncbi:MAG: hypothetical protein V4692_14560 [Bdellovibrionota bacterium]